MTIELASTRSKREITSGTKEWADYNINCIKGCYNNCRYCYAKVMAKRFGRCTEETWQEMEINQTVLHKTFRKYNGRVMFPSSHDIFDKPEVQEICLNVIDKLLDVGNDLLVTTKPRLSVTKAITKRFKLQRQQLQFRFTITSNNNNTLSFWEPNAPHFEERLSSLKLAYRMGYKTSVSVEPFLDYNPRVLLELLFPYVTESLWLGPMNYIPANGVPEWEKHHYEEIRTIYTKHHLAKIYQDLRNFPKIRFKDSMSHRLGLPRNGAECNTI